MALTVPTAAQLLHHITSEEDAAWEEDVGFSEARAEYLLPLATDLMYFASGCSTDPLADTPEARMVLQGILAMTHFLLVTDEDREETYSPFSSERMGSYSYSKMAKRVAEGALSMGDVPLFDIAANALRNLCGERLVWHTSVKVFSHDTPDFDASSTFYLGAPD